MPTKSPVPAALVIGALLWAGLTGVAAWVPLVPGEAVPLRWLRKLGEHPVRGSLALGLLVLIIPFQPAFIVQCVHQFHDIRSPGGQEKVYTEFFFIAVHAE